MALLEVTSIRFFWHFIPGFANLQIHLGEKRYSQFREIFLHYYEQADLMNVYGYGCYCLNLGDRPLSGIMTGVYPVDDKDRHCFEFTKAGFPRLIFSFG